MGDHIIRTDTETVNRIRLARTAAGLSQVEFAEAVGVHRRTVIWWEQGVHNPQKRSTWEAICRVTRRELRFFLDDHLRPRGDLDVNRTL